MLCCLMDGQARTSTELAVVAGVSPPTASSHLGKLRKADLVRLLVHGKHHYYSLKRPRVAEMLEGLMALSQTSATPFVPTTPQRLRMARSCYDHIAGALGVAVHDRLLADGWLAGLKGHDAYDVTDKGQAQFAKLGIDVGAARRARADASPARASIGANVALTSGAPSARLCSPRHSSEAGCCAISTAARCG
jgi:Bacterial regulatory protein, arsR family